MTSTAQTIAARWIVAIGMVWIATAAPSIAGAQAAPQPSGGAAAMTADPPQAEAVREAFARARMLFETGDYEDALAEFERARDMLDGHPWQLRATYNIGRCYEHLYRYDRALSTYRQYGELAPEGDQYRALIEERIERLEEVLATAHLQVTVPEYEVWIDGRLVGLSLSSVRFPGGAHRVEIRAEDRAPQSRDVNVPSRGEQTLAFDLEPLVRGVSPAYFWTTASLAVASAIAGIGIGAYAMTEHDRLMALADDPVNRWLVTEEDNDRTRRYALAADILYGVAGLFAVTATVLAFLTDWSGGSASSSDDGGEPAAATSRLRFSPTVTGRDGAGLVLEGSFR